MDPQFSTPVIAIGLVVTGFIAGVINTIAGGASALTIPALIFAGLPPSVANAANRIPVVLQCVTSTYGFARAGKLEGRDSIPLVLIFTIGSIPGSYAATIIGDRAIEWVLVLTMLGVAFFMVFSPKFKRLHELPPKKLTWLNGSAVFLVGVFGGLIQAGVGLLMLTVLVSLLNYDLTRATAIKIVSALLLACAALITFIVRGFITSESLFYALFVAIGSTSGAWVGVKLAITRGQRLIRYTGAIMAMAASVAILLR